MPRLLGTIGQVRQWADELRAERLNNTGRRMVDVVELVAMQLVDARRKGNADAVAKLAAKIESGIRAALAADKGEVDRSMVELRRRAEQQEAMASEFDGMH